MKLKNIFLGLSTFFFCVFSVNATITGVVTIADKRLGTRTVIYEAIKGNAIAEGDILIGKIRDLALKRAFILPQIGGSPWPQGIVPFELSENLPFANKLAIFEAINHWQQKTFIQFVELTSKNRANYHDYVSFVPAPGTTCASYVGKKGGPQAIQLSPRCTAMNTVEEDHRFNFEQHLTDGEDFGEYDYQSIMHYSAYAFSKNGEKTIVPLAEDTTIGQREQLSEKDITAISALYPEPR